MKGQKKTNHQNVGLCTHYTLLQRGKTKKYNGNTQNGITLVALVVTIVVLLLLAGITIATLLGNNGIILRAQEAKEKTEIERLTELVAMAVSNLTIDHLGDTSQITPQEIVEEIKRTEGRTDVTAKDATFPTYIAFEKEGKEIPVNLTGTTSGDDNDENGVYSVAGVEDKIAPQDLFYYETISESEKTARITGIKEQYCNLDGYSKESGTKKYEDTNYEIKYEGITDTLVIPYQLEINGELYKVTEVNADMYYYYEGKILRCLPDIQSIIYPNTVTKIYCENRAFAHDVANEGPLNITLSTNLTEIPDDYLMHCHKLKVIRIPSSVTSIPIRRRGDKWRFRLLYLFDRHLY